MREPSGCSYFPVCLFADLLSICATRALGREDEAQEAERQAQELGG
jgi:hypothetical protein